MNGILHGKVALVTGSTTGIGEAIAKRFASEGAKVMVHGLSEPDAQAVVGDILNLGGQAAYIIGDLVEPCVCRNVVDSVLSTFSQIDIMVNNAATTARSDLETTTPSFFDHTMAVNVRAPMLLIQAARNYLIQSRGTVLNIGSVNGYCGEKNLLAYAISKGGLMTLSRNLADALSPDGIRVNHFNLGWILTKNELLMKIRDGLPDNWPEKLPLTIAPAGRLITPDEIAHFALSFVDPASGPISGCVVELEQYPMIGRNPVREVSA